MHTRNFIDTSPPFSHKISISHYAAANFEKFMEQVLLVKKEKSKISWAQQAKFLKVENS